jgi:hypothetical protein
MKYVLVIVTILFISMLFADDLETEILNTETSWHPLISLTCGIQYNLGSTRINLKYYSKTIIYTVSYNNYDTFFIGTKPFKEGTVLRHNELSTMFNKIFYIPNSNVHCSLGTGLLYRIRTVRNERISYENWTTEQIHDLGLPVELNLESFLIPKPFVLSFSYKAIFYKEKFYHCAFLDIGFWFGRKYNN